MPKKTLKQKILSDRHQKVSTNTYTFSYSPREVTNQHKSLIPLDKYVKSDIRKTMLLGSIFILLEFVLYWVMNFRK